MISKLLVLAKDKRKDWRTQVYAIRTLGQLGQNNPVFALALFECSKQKDKYVREAAYTALKDVVGNLRYAELDNGQKRIKRTGRKTVGRKQKAVGRKQKTKKSPIENQKL